MRVKAVVHCQEGWLSCNRLSAEGAWQVSAWRRDSRIELIFGGEQDAQHLHDELLRCAFIPD
ncbi:hypothetical protein D9M70_543880 [compost metagenome]